MGRAPCQCEDKEGLKKGAWTAEEDEKLVSFIENNKGHGSWRTLPKLAGLERCGKSCRLRWTNYLRPNIKRGNFTPEEERVIIQLHALMGNRWSSIASHLHGRTDNEVKNHWNTHLKKRLAKMGIDPTTHLPLPPLLYNPQDVATNYYSQLLSSTHAYYNHHNNADWRRALLQRSLPPTMACHLVQWELARLEAEARVKLAAASCSQEYMQNYAAWLQSCADSMSLPQQNQPPSSAYNFCFNFQSPQAVAAAAAAAATVAPSSSDSLESQQLIPLQPSPYSSCEADSKYADHFLKQFDVPSTNINEEKHNPLDRPGAASSCRRPDLFNYIHSSTLSSPFSEEGLPQLDHIRSDGIRSNFTYTSTVSSIATTPDTCSSETTSCQLVSDQLQLSHPDNDLGLVTAAAAAAAHPLLNPPSSPSLMNGHTASNSLHDSYWDKMLNLLENF